MVKLILPILLVLAVASVGMIPMPMLVGIALVALLVTLAITRSGGFLDVLASFGGPRI